MEGEWWVGPLLEQKPDDGCDADEGRREGSLALFQEKRNDRLCHHRPLFGDQQMRK